MLIFSSVLLTILVGLYFYQIADISVAPRSLWKFNRYIYRDNSADDQIQEHKNKLLDIALEVILAESNSGAVSGHNNVNTKLNTFAPRSDTGNSGGNKINQGFKIITNDGISSETSKPSVAGKLVENKLKKDERYQQQQAEVGKNMKDDDVTLEQKSNIKSLLDTIDQFKNKVGKDLYSDHKKENVSFFFFSFFTKLS